MKRISTLIIASLMTFLVGAAESTSEEESLETLSQRLTDPAPLFEVDKPNEIKTEWSVTYSGIVPQLLKTDNVFQLFNPAAPERYGFAEQNVVRDPIDNKVSGLKLFSIQF